MTSLFRSGRLIVIGLVCLFWAGGTAARASLVIYYPLDETAGNMANDSSTFGGFQSATATVGASNWQPAGGILGGALLLTPTAQADVDEALSYTSATPILNNLPLT